MAFFISDNEIDNICKTIVESIRVQYPYYYPHILFMYWYGCRIGELFDFRVRYDGLHSKVIIRPQKNNNDRILDIVNFEVPAVIEQINLTQYNSYINKRNLQRIIEKVHPYRQLKCGNKKIGAHLFRHNFIKKSVASGSQIVNLDKEMGYTNQTVADTYLISKIYY